MSVVIQKIPSLSPKAALTAVDLILEIVLLYFFSRNSIKPYYFQVFLAVVKCYNANCKCYFMNHMLWELLGFK